MFPARFPTGVRKTTIPNPATLFTLSENATRFQGQVEDYDFKFQAANFLRLQKALNQFGTSLGPIASVTYPAEAGCYYDGTTSRTLTRFVSCSKDGSLMWEKYEGNTPGSGQNYVYAGGQKIKLTTFLGYTDAERRAWMSGDKVLMTLVNADSWFWR